MTLPLPLCYARLFYFVSYSQEPLFLWSFEIRRSGDLGGRQLSWQKHVDAPELRHNSRRNVDANCGLEQLAWRVAQFRFESLSTESQSSHESSITDISICSHTHIP